MTCADRLAAEHARCGCNRLLETVPVHSDLTCDMPRQERECGGPLQALNANSGWQFRDKPVPKICFASDSKAALGMLNVLRLPSGKLEHLTPKIERVTGWAEDCAETLYWAIARLFVPGEGGVACNSLCDYIVRFVGALGKMRGVQIGDGNFA